MENWAVSGHKEIKKVIVWGTFVMRGTSVCSSKEGLEFAIGVVPD